MQSLSVTTGHDVLEKDDIFRGPSDRCSLLLVTADSREGKEPLPLSAVCVFGHMSAFRFLHGNGKDGFTYLADKTSHKSTSHRRSEV